MKKNYPTKYRSFRFRGAKSRRWRGGTFDTVDYRVGGAKKYKPKYTYIQQYDEPRPYVRRNFLGIPDDGKRRY